MKKILVISKKSFGGNFFDVHSSQIKLPTTVLIHPHSFLRNARVGVSKKNMTIKKYITSNPKWKKWTITGKLMFLQCTCHY